MQFTSGIANWLVNKRRTATTASDHPIVPTANKLTSTISNEEATPFVDLRFNSYMPQQHINMCGDAVVAMLYAYHGDNAGINLSVNTRGALEGTTAEEMRGTYAKLRRWRPLFRENATPKNYAALTPERLAYGLLSVGPLAAPGSFARFLGGRWGHWVLVTGIVNGMVYMADPWHGEDRQKSFAWFLEHLSPLEAKPMLYYSAT